MSVSLHPCSIHKQKGLVEVVALLKRGLSAEMAADWFEWPNIGQIVNHAAGTRWARD